MTVPEVVLFDLDGTLSDSAPGILGSLRLAFAEVGVPPLDAATERTLLGPPFAESLPPLLPDPALLPDVVAAYRRHYGAGGMYDTRPFDGVAEVVTALRDAGVRLAVATSKPEPYAAPIVEHLGLGGLFDTVAGDDLAGTRGSKALVVDEALRRLGRPDPALVLMVGDRLHDVEGARAHGVDCLAVAWGYAPPGELEAARPRAVCATPGELAAALGLAVAPR